MLTAITMSRREQMRLDRSIRPVLAHGSLLRMATRISKGEPPTAYGIAETFEVWVVDATALEDHPQKVDISHLARHSAQLHHQLRLGSTGHGYARSAPARGGRMAKSISVARVATVIHDGIRLLDAKVRADATVRLLVIPIAHVTALWIVPKDCRRETRVLVVSAPKTLRVTRRALVPSSQLLRAVVRAHDRVHPTRNHTNGHVEE
jgi:hypothetical protein